VTGVLYLCATPIGNLEDITLRVLRVLREVALIAAEDTRQTRKLLNHYKINTPLTSYHRHSATAKEDRLLAELLAGRDVALVSDAGMPGISDPGEQLVVRVVEEGIRVVPVPGPSAVTTALVVSGLPTNRFVFEGFLPRQGKARRQRLADLAKESRTMVFYEAPHRLLATLTDLHALMGNRQVAVVREVTKLHEEVLRCSLAEAAAHFTAQAPRGELTLVVAGRPGGESIGAKTGGQGAQVAEGSFLSDNPGGLDLAEAVTALVQAGRDGMPDIKALARRYGVPKREVYAMALAEREKQVERRK